MRDIIIEAAIETMPSDKRPIILEGDIPHDRRIYFAAPPRSAQHLSDLLIRSTIPHNIERSQSSPMRGVKYTSSSFVKMLPPEVLAMSSPEMINEAKRRNMDLSMERFAVSEAASMAALMSSGGKSLMGDLSPLNPEIAKKISDHRVMLERITLDDNADKNDRTISKIIDATAGIPGRAGQSKSASDKRESR